MPQRKKVPAWRTAEITLDLEYLQIASRSDDAHFLQHVADNTIFGPYLQQMIDQGRQFTTDGHFDVPTIRQALLVAATLFAAADWDARHVHHSEGKPTKVSFDSRPLNPSFPTEAQLDEYRSAMIKGGHSPLPEAAYMSVPQSQAQVKAADALIGRQTHQVAAALSALNYDSIFNPNTMPGVEETLRLVADTPALVQTDDIATMKHLAKTNAAIGMTVALVASNARARLFDLGAGSGATLAASLRAIELRNPEIARALRVHAVDASPNYTFQLETELPNSELVQRLGLTVERDDSTIRPVQPSQLRVTRGDLVETAIAALANEPSAPDEVTIFTMNYVSHRIPSKHERPLFEAAARLQNSIFLIGDLEDNTSPFNRGGMNWGGNGALNPGNFNLVRDLQAAGYTIVDLAREAPAGLDNELRRQMLADVSKDGHYWIAYRGDLAKEALSLEPVERDLVPTVAPAL